MTGCLHKMVDSSLSTPPTRMSSGVHCLRKPMPSELSFFIVLSVDSSIAGYTEAMSL